MSLFVVASSLYMWERGMYRYYNFQFPFHRRRYPRVLRVHSTVDKFLSKDKSVLYNRCKISAGKSEVNIKLEGTKLFTSLKHIERIWSAYPNCPDAMAYRQSMKRQRRRIEKHGRGKKGVKTENLDILSSVQNPTSALQRESTRRWRRCVGEH